MKEEELKHRFIVECEAFSRLDGNDPYDKEAMGILYEFVQKELSKAKQETWDKAAKRIGKMKSHCREYHNSYINTPERIDIFNITIDWSVAALKQAKEKDI